MSDEQLSEIRELQEKIESLEKWDAYNRDFLAWMASALCSLPWTVRTPFETVFGKPIPDYGPIGSCNAAYNMLVAEMQQRGWVKHEYA